MDDIQIPYSPIRHSLFLGIAFTLLIAVPLSVHAGVLDIFFDTAVAESERSSLPSYEYNESAQFAPLLKAALNSDPNPAKGGGDIIVSDGALVPHGDVDGKEDLANTRTVNGEISLYVVRDGDTLSQIADMFDVSAKTILWANDIKDVNTIRPGDSLVILPITGVRHVVKKGDTIATIAKKYSGDVDDILAYNQLASGEDVVVGDTIVIPDGTITTPTPSKTKSGSGSKLASGGGSAGFVNPLPGSVKTQGIHGYNGVDLSGVSIGSAVVAAAGGEVIVAKGSGWNGGYGAYVVVKHANGVQTLYAHLSSVAVTSGQSVGQGQKIGGMGNSGRSTGPHLHFEVRGARNPF